MSGAGDKIKRNLAINGFGRIGRSFLRAALEDSEFPKLFSVVAINDTTNAKTLAHLFRYDSTFGKFDGEVIATDDSILVNGNQIRVLQEKDPSTLPWKKMQVDLLLESTGKFKDANEAKKHIDAGARKVVISAPAKGLDATLLVGINEKTYIPDKHNIVSMASCTTNCIAPVVKVLNERFGIESGYMTTVHAYTNDQRLLDSPHKDLRRARAASMSIIPTTTGAAKSIGTIIPDLEGKIDGMALRVPVNNGSIADVVVTLERGATREEINAALREASEKELRAVMAYSEEPLVSADIVGEPYSSIVDGLSTMVLGEKSRTVKVLSWYDNEWSFACRLVDLIKFIGSKME
jgi:glyceraldehyde 3-phosphate dehydrogenase